MVAKHVGERACRVGRGGHGHQQCECNDMHGGTVACAVMMVGNTLATNLGRDSETLVHSDEDFYKNKYKKNVRPTVYWLNG